MRQRKFVVSCVCQKYSLALLIYEHLPHPGNKKRKLRCKPEHDGSGSLPLLRLMGGDTGFFSVVERRHSVFRECRELQNEGWSEDFMSNLAVILRKDGCLGLAACMQGISSSRILEKDTRILPPR